MIQKIAFQSIYKHVFTFQYGTNMPCNIRLVFILLALEIAIDTIVREVILKKKSIQKITQNQ